MSEMSSVSEECICRLRQAAEFIQEGKKKKKERESAVELVSKAYFLYSPFSLPVREPWTFTLRQTQLIGAKCSTLGAPMTPGSFNLSSICNPLKHSFGQWLAWGSSSCNVFSLIFSKLWRHKLLIYFSLPWSWLRNAPLLEGNKRGKNTL